MNYYRVCPFCGAHLDPGERCDCRDEGNAPIGATNTDGGKAERKLHYGSVSNYTKEMEDFKA